MNKKTLLFKPSAIESSSDFEMLKSMIYLYSCHRKLSGRASTPLRSALLTLLALYVKFGYSKDTKVKAEKILGLETHAINSLNHQLRGAGYLEVDDNNTTINHLCKPLKTLGEYYKKSVDSQQDFIFAFHLKFGENETRSVI